MADQTRERPKVIETINFCAMRKLLATLYEVLSTRLTWINPTALLHLEQETLLTILPSYSYPAIQKATLSQEEDHRESQSILVDATDHSIHINNLSE